MSRTQASESQDQRQKSSRALKTISEAAEIIDVPQHVLRFWETKFTQIKPLKRNGGRRFYRPEDIELLLKIKSLLYKQGYTIKGAKKAFDQKQVDAVMASFSDVGKGEATAASNDNPAKTADDAKASKTNAKQETIKQVISNLKDVSKTLRDAK